MTNSLAYPKEYPVYPGQYISPLGVDLLHNEFNVTGKVSAPELFTNMDEYKDCFEVSLSIPGVKREDIFIHVWNNILSIAVLKRHCENFKKEALQIIEFDNDCPGRHIQLPDNAGAEISSTEYKQGILSICIPKGRLNNQALS